MTKRIITTNAKKSFLLKSVRKKISLSHCYKNSLEQIEGCLGHVCEQDSYSLFCWTLVVSTLRGWPGKIFPVTLSQRSIAELPTQKKFPKQSEVWLSSSFSYIIWREIFTPWNKIVFVISIFPTMRWWYVMTCLYFPRHPAEHASSGVRYP